MTVEILLQLLLGGLLGMTGQALRVVVGLKKLNDGAADTGAKLKDVLVPSRIVISLLIGFAAGLLAMVSISTFQANFISTDTKKVILSLLAAGYAGTDFIEGFIVKFLPNAPATSKPVADGYKTISQAVTQPAISVPAKGATTSPKK